MLQTPTDHDNPMKTTPRLLSLISLVAALGFMLASVSCTTETTTNLDGSVTVTKRLDSAAINAGGTVVQKVAPIFYGSRAPVTYTNAKGVVEVQPEPETSWLSMGMSLLGF